MTQVIKLSDKAADRIKEIEAQRYRDAPRGTRVGDRKV